MQHSVEGFVFVFLAKSNVHGAYVFDRGDHLVGGISTHLFFLERILIEHLLNTGNMAVEAAFGPLALKVEPGPSLIL